MVLENLCVRRKALDFCQAGLAVMLGVTEKQIVGWESGAIPRNSGEAMEAEAVLQSLEAQDARRRSISGQIEEQRRKFAQSAPKVVQEVQEVDVVDWQKVDLVGQEKSSEQKERAARRKAWGQERNSAFMGQLREQKETAGLTWEEVAKQIGVQHVTMASWVSGVGSPSKKNLRKLKAVLARGLKSKEKRVKSQWVWEQRMKKGLSQEQLAKRVGVSAATILRWERGYTQPPKKYSKALINALASNVEQEDRG